MAKHDYFSDESLRKDLKKKTVRGGVITGIAHAFSVLLSLFTIPFLARLLMPSDFGLIAMVSVFINFGSMFVDAGLSRATVQRNNITKQQVTNLFWFALSFGFLIAVIVACCSPIIARFYGEPRLQAITLAMAISYVFSGATVQHQALLQRGMRFGAISITHLAATFIGQVSGIIYAYYNHGTDHAYWALVIIPIVSNFTNLIGKWLACSWRPSLPKRHAGTRELIVFGANLTGFNFINYFSRNADKLLIGWWWGEVILGYYEQAYRIMFNPIRALMPKVNAVVVPALSRLQIDPDKYRHAYMSAFQVIIWLTTPFVGLMFAASDPFISIYLGENWKPVIPILQALIPAAWAATLLPVTGWCFSSWGHVNVQLRWGIVNSLVILPTILISFTFGVQVVAISLGIAFPLLRFVSFWICFKNTPIRMHDIIRGICYPTTISIVCGFFAYIVDIYCVARLGMMDDYLLRIIIILISYVALATGIVCLAPSFRREISLAWKPIAEFRSKKLPKPNSVI